jgi:23S rRNA pseudouridine1911/1915/1917 synthase
MISTAITTVAIFNARIPSPISAFRSAVFRSVGIARKRVASMTFSQPLQAAARTGLTATADQAGERVDRFVAEGIGTISRSRVKVLIEEGHLTADGRTVKEPAETVRTGVSYVLDIPPPAPARPLPQTIPFTILHEDDDLIVLDKPAGLVVHPAPGNPDGTLVNALLAHCGPSFLGIGAERRPGIVHRLDKDTSGVMVVAKTQLASDKLTTAFANRDLDRTYQALCWGRPLPAAGEIQGAIGRDKRDRKRMAVVTHGGKPALTRYRTLRAWNDSLALLECRLATGRTHQIRVHMASIGHPIVGDPMYLRRVPAAAKAIVPPLRDQLLDFPRQALHAARLGFVHPRTGQTLCFETPLPADMATLLDHVEGMLHPR